MHLLERQIGRRTFLKAGVGLLVRSYLPDLTSLDGNSTNLLVTTYHEGITGSLLAADYSFCRKQGWQPIGLESLGNFFTKGVTLPRYCFLPTFDDGFLVQKGAILEAMDRVKNQWNENYQAILFVISQYEHKTEPVDQLPLSSLTFKESEAEKAEGPRRHVNIGEVLELLKEGKGFIRIEDHTVDHDDLTSPLRPLEEHLAQIPECKRRTDILYQLAGLERIYSALAYPYWNSNQIVRQAVAEAGFNVAFGAMFNPSLQKIMQPIEQTPDMRFCLQRMSRT